MGRWKYIRNLHPEYAFTTHLDLVAGRLGQRAFFSTWEAAARTNTEAAALLKRYHARPAEELYDLSTDPHEQRNLAAERHQAERLAELRAALDAWIKQQGDTKKNLRPPALAERGGQLRTVGGNHQRPMRTILVLILFLAAVARSGGEAQHHLHSQR